MTRYTTRLIRTSGAFGAAVAALLAAAVALRVLLIVAYTPAILNYPDEGSYVGAAAHGLFDNFARPAGYSVFLRLVHVFTASLPLTIAVQHVLGLATAALVYALARRVGASRWAALVPAAIVALSGDQLYFEHALLSDGLFEFLLLLTCYCGVRVTAAHRAGSPRASLRWAIAAGAFAALSTTVRTVGVVIGGVLVLWLLAVDGPGWRQRLTGAAAAGLVCAALLLGYAFAQQSQTGVFGLSRFSGWPLYARVAPFADCAKFTPPAGTRGLCQTLPPNQRPPMYVYVWRSASPAWRLFGPPPSGGDKLAAFARAAILAQPGAYLSAVARDLWLYLWPYAWTGAAQYALDKPAVTTVTALNLPPVRAYWGPTVVRINGSIARFLEHWRGIVRIHPWMLLLGALMGLAGMLLTGDRVIRERLALLWVLAFVLLLTAVGVSFNEWRYGVQPGILLVLTGVTGAEVLGRRMALTTPAKWLHSPARVLGRGGR